MLVSDLDDPGTHQLSAAITRARMCQNIAARMDLPPEAAFTVGLISAVAELLGQPAADLAVRLSLSHEVTEALIAGIGPLGELLSLVGAYEASDLPMLLAAPLPVEDTARAYLDAVAYTGQIIAPRARPAS
jgi:EAL and modified HD-GYP domain-containing signal transduction protein